MRRIFHHYQIWEDWKAGMYRTSAQIDDAESEELIQLAQDLLSKPRSLYKAMSEVSIYWKYASESNLSHIGINRKAWLGQAACCYVHRVPEHLTKLGWHRLTPDQQEKANEIAIRVIQEWEQQNRRRLQ
jgi:hypothetical protein